MTEVTGGKILQRGTRILGAVILLTLIWAVSSAGWLASHETMQAKEGEWGPTLKKGPSRASLTQESLLDILRLTASGPVWLVAEGIDPRFQKRPPWDTLTKMAWSELDGVFFNASDSLQAPGGTLVPFRDPAPSFSRNILLTRDFSNVPIQTEPHIAVNPNDPEHLIVGVIDYNFPSNTAYVSFDAGQSWEGPIQLGFPREDLISAGDPVVGFGPSGNAHFLSISIGSDEFAVGTFVFEADVSSIAHSSSLDGGLNWSESRPSAKAEISSDISLDLTGRPRGVITLPFLDKPWLAVGPHPSDPDGEIIYVSYTEFSAELQVLYIGEVPQFAVNEVKTTIKLVRSEDSGVTWSDPIAISPTARRVSGSDIPAPGEAMAEGLKRVVQGSQPVIASDGTVYVVWMDTTNDGSQKGAAEIYVARSDDSGRTFSEPIRASTFREPGFRPKTAFFRYWGSSFPQVAAGSDGEIYIVFVGLNPSVPTDDGDVYFVRSLDGGTTWSRKRSLGGDETDRLQFFPAITTDPTGNLHVMWGDMRDDPIQTRYHIYYTTSDDRGESWGFKHPELNLISEDTRMTDYSSNANKGFPNGLFLGDYFAITATDDDVFAVWSDTRLGEYGPPNQKIGFARRSAIASAEVFLSPPAGAGGQEVTLQGFNFQPDMNVFIQVGGVTVAAERTNSLGRFTGKLFMPVSGSGAQDILVFDESGNLASTSFFAEFGFGDIRVAQEQLEERLDLLVRSLGAGKVQETLIEDDRTDGIVLTSWWVATLMLIGGVLVGALGMSIVSGPIGRMRRQQASMSEG